ncbi:thioredoxin family protein [Capnocytophaga catalasegens]|uniref:Thioredoxin n=1 Tax=Capnocytophaga catalasegens TaxID=1004260 RepID=A0AAV5ASA4_9FLAO|nr:thioredoxin family protein [Capnocytophaga catalasegens]GIZ16060.1 thioredoxin [Capnocytophaga catalasegens]GJM50219.1 thioredoxin [Capnocytophaga catalasegens]GJM53450.1 thioredoxin [Capnocytophaga catalasegens]
MLKEIIENSLQKAFTYTEYMALMDKLVAEKRTTGQDQSQEMVSFTQLNYQRMKRLDKALKISEEQAAYFQKIDKKQTWLVITEAWCGDASQIVPMLNKIAQTNSNIELKLVLRDENEALMNLFLTNGGKAIPMLIILNTSTLEVLNVWGPRPTIATKMVEDYKTKYGKLTSEFKEELQKWYNQNKGQSIVNDLISLLK